MPKKPAKRAVTLWASMDKSGIPREVEVFSFFCEFRVRTEVLLHERFAAKRTSGEWFLLNDYDVKAFISASAEYATEAEEQYAVDEVHQAKLAYKEFVKSPEYQAHLLECVNRAFGK